MTKLLDKKRRAVLDYLETCLNTPLAFKKQYSTDTQLYYPDGNLPLKDLVVQVLAMSEKFASATESTKRVETPSSCLRSAVDIWRHVIAVKKDVTIFDIMETIYSIRDRLYGHFCITVERTVFKLDDYPMGAPTQSPRDFVCEEFTMTDGKQLVFAQWRKLQ